MFHGRIRPATELDTFHPVGCPCADCALSRDPITFSRDRRRLRLQAAGFAAVALAFYAFAAANLSGILAAFGVTL